MLAVVVFALTEHDPSGVEIVQASGVVVAVEATSGVEGKVLVDAGLHHIKPVERPVEAEAEGLFPSPLRLGASDGIEHFRSVFLVVLNQLQHGAWSGVVLQGTVGKLQGVGGKPVVGIKHGDVFPLGELQPEVSCDGLTAVDGCAQQLETAVGGGIGLENAVGRIGGAVVDADELTVGKCLALQGVETGAQILLAVIDSGQHGHFRHSRCLSLGRSVVSFFSTWKERKTDTSSMRAVTALSHEFSCNAVNTDTAQHTNWNA